MTGENLIVLLVLFCAGSWVWGRLGNYEAVQRGAVGTGSTAIWLASIAIAIAIWGLLLLIDVSP